MKKKKRETNLLVKFPGVRGKTDDMETCVWIDFGMFELI